MSARTPAPDVVNFHGQTTFTWQGYPAFRSPYQGPNSLPAGGEGRETIDATLYAGVRLWEGAELWLNPEIDQGFGLGNTLGVAGFTSGEAYKIGFAYPYTRLQRAFIRQTIDLGSETQKVDAGINQFAGSQTANRVVITVGKFSVADIFDNNKYARDPRNDFLNWAIIDTGIFDYAAEPWGYTLGAAAGGDWTLRGGLFDLSILPNNLELDPGFQQFQWVGEIERRYELWGHPGKIAVTGFLSRGRMGTYQDAIALAQITGGPADIAAVRQYRSRGGLSMNLEQEITSDLGAFVRAGVANGHIEPYEFTDIDRTVAAGLAFKGTQWRRPDDTFGLAGVVNGISAEHEAFFNAGGRGILIGDGQLAHPGLERSSRLTTNSRSPSGASRSTISSSPIPLITATAVLCPCSGHGCTPSFEETAASWRMCLPKVRRAQTRGGSLSHLLRCMSPVMALRVRYCAASEGQLLGERRKRALKASKMTEAIIREPLISASRKDRSFSFA